jgi:hypothetical protein
MPIVLEIIGGILLAGLLALGTYHAGGFIYRRVKQGSPTDAPPKH